MLALFLLFVYTDCTYSSPPPPRKGST
jgi:hypothetical protein